MRWCHPSRPELQLVLHAAYTHAKGNTFSRISSLAVPQSPSFTENNNKTTDGSTVTGHQGCQTQPIGCAHANGMEANMHRRYLSTRAGSQSSNPGPKEQTDNSYRNRRNMNTMCAPVLLAPCAGARLALSTAARGAPRSPPGLPSAPSSLRNRR